MAEYFPYDVFLNHSVADRETVRALAERLRGDGLKVWFEGWEINPGDDRAAKIEQGLEQARVMILCLSQNAYGAEWVELEGSTFRFRNPLDKDRRFIPVRLDETAVKDSLGGFVCFEWRTNEPGDNYARLLEACRPPATHSATAGDGSESQVSLISSGHTGAVRSVAWSADGQQVISGSQDKAIRLWEVKSRRCLRVLEGHDNSVLSVAWNPNSQQVISGSGDNTVRLWDVKSGRCLRVLEGHSATVYAVAWSPDGQQFISGSHDNTVRLWEVKSGRCLRVLEGHSATVLSVAWSPDSQQVISGSGDNTVRLWEVKTGRCLRVLEGHSASVYGVAWSPDGQHVISGSHDKTVRLWEVKSGRCLRTLEGHSATVYGVAWSPDSQQVISGSHDQRVRLWEVKTARCVEALEEHSDTVYGVAWSPDGEQVISGSGDETVRLWEVKSGRCLPVEVHSDTVYGVVWSPDGQQVISGSGDNTLRHWEAKSGRCLRVLKGHSAAVLSVAWSPDGQHVLSGSADKTVRLWQVKSGGCLRVLERHSDAIYSVAWSPDGQHVLSGSVDKTVRLWEVKSGNCLRVLDGHSATIYSVAWSPDGQHVLSGSMDKTVRLWEVKSGRCLRVLEGHSATIYSVAWSPDGQHVLSGSMDKTVRLWEVKSGRCLRVLEGHSATIYSVAWSPDGQHVLSGSMDKTVRLWEVKSGRCLRVLEGHSDAVRNAAWSPDGQQIFSAADNGVARVWETQEREPKAISVSKDSSPAKPLEKDVQYTNAKVLLVGESGAGKTGLTERLANNNFTPSFSTSGAWSTQWAMQNLPPEPGWEREVWLWDFGGQADQRLIHQLYLDKTALVLLVFNSDRDTVISGLREWQQALHRSISRDTPVFLIAGRTDVGFRFDREKVNQFAAENRFKFFETSAQSGTGCEALRKAIQDGIPWKLLERRTSPIIFKLLKDEILRLRDEGHVLVTFKELREVLRHRLATPLQSHGGAGNLPAPVGNLPTGIAGRSVSSGEAPDDTGGAPVLPKTFTDSDLETVVGLLDGPGVVKELNFGTYILLRPEWINAYAQAVIRTLKSARKSLGCLPVQSIAEGKLIFQTTQADGKIVEEKRLKKNEEPIVLQAMEQALLERKLCLRQEEQLVFPSYYGLEQPSGPTPPKYFISYAFGGFLDDIYATLVVQLAYCGAFSLKELWRDAADFLTLAEGKKMGIKLLRKEDGRGELLVHFEKGVAPQEQVIFATYIHDHLKEKASDVVRLRFYVCPHCDTPVKNREVAMQRLEDKGEKAKIICVDCEKYVPLWDDLEKRFASESVQKKVELLKQQEHFELDSRRKGKLLALEVGARITSANQKCFEVPGSEDEGIDMELEFTENDGRGSGQRLYLQLKSGNSYLTKRKKDGAEIFAIKKQAWVKYWLKQGRPVMLVVGTFPEERHPGSGGKEDRFADIRWMEISELLRKESNDGKKPVRQIVFTGERLDVLSVRALREKVLGLGKK